MTLKEQIIAMLVYLGVPTPPDFLVDAWIDRTSQIDDCMDKAGYSEADKTLIRVYLLSLFAVASGDGQVRSKSAPSGASISYQFKSAGETYRYLRGLLSGIDKNGCAIGLIPPSPDKESFGGLYVSSGGCYE